MVQTGYIGGRGLSILRRAVQTARNLALPPGNPMKQYPLSLHAFLPVLPVVRKRELLRVALGCVVGLAACLALARALPTVFGLPVALMAPLGASAVLIFGVPNAPLAQPWSALAGNMVAALVAVAVLRFLPGPWAPALAVGGAVMAMLLARALHPPGGAVALLAVLEPAPVLELGFAFALVPVGLLTALLVAVGVLFNRLTGRVYPFRQADSGDLHEPIPRLGLTGDELAGLLTRFNQSPNIGVADLARLLAAAEEEAAAHRFEGVTCAEIMTPGLITVTPDASLAQITALFRRHAIKSLPVVDAEDRFLGIILQRDIINVLISPRSGRLRRRRADILTAGTIMHRAERAVSHDMPVGNLLHRLAVQGGEAIPVIDGDKLVGIITRTDIMSLLIQVSDTRREEPGNSTTAAPGQGRRNYRDR